MFLFSLHETNKLNMFFHRGDNKHLASANAALKVSLEKARRRVTELERQNIQHGELADKMRQRLRQMDEHAKRGSGQVGKNLPEVFRLINYHLARSSD